MRAAGLHTAGPHRSALWLLVLAFCGPVLLPVRASDSAQVVAILEQLREHFNRIEDYQVDLRVSLKLPRLRMPRKKMTLAFKQPDQLRLKARGFAMVPRRGVLLAPDSLFARLQEPTIVGERLIDGHPTVVIRGVQQMEGEGIVVAELVVDTLRWVVLELVTYLEGQEIFRLESTYLEAAPGIYMPRETRLRFALGERFLRGRRGPPLPSGARKMLRDPDISDAIAPDEGRPVIGEATIVFSGYRINHGIPDAYFEEEDEGGETD